MRFGDVVTAVASSAVVMVLAVVPLQMVLIPALGFDWGQNVSVMASVLLSALIVGYIFAGKIHESRMEAIAKITVLSAVLVMFSVTLNAAALADWTPWVKEAYREMYGTTALSTYEWMIVEGMWLAQVTFFNVIIVLVLGFIGLYVGSKLRQPAKSRE